MKRKAIQLAGKTLLVSLPHMWVEQQHIRKGQDLFVDVQGEMLIISGKAVALLDQAETRIEDEEDAKSLLYLYQKGVDCVRVTYAPGCLKHIESYVSRLQGWEITEQGKQHCTIAAIAVEKEETFTAIYQRAWHVLLQMSDDINNGTAQDIIAREETVDKLTDFCKRLLNKYPRQDKAYLYAVIRDIEKIADCYAALAGEKLKKEDLLYLRQVHTFLECTRALFFKKNDQTMSLYLQKRKQWYRTKNAAQPTRAKQYLSTIVDLLGELYGPAVML